MMSSLYQGTPNVSEVTLYLQSLGAWAAHRRFLSPQPRPVLLESTHSQVWRELGRQIRRSAPLPDYELAGPIVVLRREGQAESSGTIEVRSLIEGKLSRVLVELPPAEYSQALSAHNERRWFLGLGELGQEGRHFRLRNPREVRFEAVEEE